jgi:hypothetical protein
VRGPLFLPELRHLPLPGAPLMITSQHSAANRDSKPQNDLGTAVQPIPAAHSADGAFRGGHVLCEENGAQMNTDVGDMCLTAVHATVAAAPTRFRSEGSAVRRRALVPMPSYHPISDADPGTTFGNHRASFPRHPGASPGMVFAVPLLELTPGTATRSLSLFALQARGHRFETCCAHQVRGCFE